ncbi:putative nucleoside-diphosphate sugar epimerase [Mycobacterium sp. JS623]|uniref:NAD(P)H-binding protein n=1 Tax=Mycobacterium sp. JS623 TaxID=212767 RepID=UPI0002A55674|nr:NAD(P)H-binding protein [Mycobacterium sp. JS623]AGB21710.1 putative nucleoside-diphosphate sugar epimerase [Mycobacterium sp. JS623]
MYLITGAGGGIGSVSRRVVQQLLDDGEQVRAMVRRDDERADQLRATGADVIVGDLTSARDIVDAMIGVRRMFFNMSVSPDYLRATTEVCAVALERGEVDVIVNMSQMTVSQMTLTGTGESNQHRLHWLAEHVLNWSGLPVIHVRPTTFLDNPLFTSLAKQAVHERGVLALPFGTGRTSPISADDVARVVVALLRHPDGRIGEVYELTGPEVLDINGLAEHYSRALNRPITAEDLVLDEWERRVLTPVGLPDHVNQHIATMARLHREGRYDRRTDDVEQITGQAAQTVEQYVASNPDLFY